MAKLAKPKAKDKPAAPKKPSTRSKTGNAACSEAASNWQLSLRGKAALSPDTYQTLAKCRAMNRTAKMAEGYGRTGKLSAMGEQAVKARLQSRFDAGLITQKSRTEKLNALLKQRSERGKVEEPKTAFSYGVAKGETIPAVPPEHQAYRSSEYVGMPKQKPKTSTAKPAFDPKATYDPTKAIESDKGGRYWALDSSGNRFPTPFKTKQAALERTTAHQALKQSQIQGPTPPVAPKLAPDATIPHRPGFLFDPGKSKAQTLVDSVRSNPKYQQNKLRAKVNQSRVKSEIESNPTFMGVFRGSQRSKNSVYSGELGLNSRKQREARLAGTKKELAEKRSEREYYANATPTPPVAPNLAPGRGTDERKAMAEYKSRHERGNPVYGDIVVRNHAKRKLAEKFMNDRLARETGGTGMLFQTGPTRLEKMVADLRVTRAATGKGLPQSKKKIPGAMYNASYGSAQVVRKPATNEELKRMANPAAPAPKVEYSLKNPWHGRREDVFKAMRDLDNDIQNYHRDAQRFSPRPGTIGIGGADFDHQLRANVAESYQRALRRGKTPDEALQDAIKDGRESVKLWNERGSKGRASIGGRHELKRWENAGDDIAYGIHRKFSSFSEPSAQQAAPAPPRYSLGGQLAPGRGTVERKQQAEFMAATRSLDASRVAAVLTKNRPGAHYTSSGGTITGLDGPSGRVQTASVEELYMAHRARIRGKLNLPALNKREMQKSSPRKLPKPAKAQAPKPSTPAPTPTPTPTPARYSLGGKLAPGRGTESRQKLAKQKIESRLRYQRVMAAREGAILISEKKRLSSGFTSVDLVPGYGSYNAQKTNQIPAFVKPVGKNLAVARPADFSDTIEIRTPDGRLKVSDGTKITAEIRKAKAIDYLLERQKREMGLDQSTPIEALPFKEGRAKKYRQAMKSITMADMRGGYDSQGRWKARGKISR